MNIVGIFTEIYYRLNVANGNPFWSDTQIQDAVNEGYRHFAETTLCFKKFGFIQIAADTSIYDLPTDLIKLIWVGYDGRELRDVSSKALDKTDPAWLSQGGTPGYYTHDLGGIKQISLYLQPESAGTTIVGTPTLAEYYADYSDNLLLLYNYADSDFDALDVNGDLDDTDTTTSDLESNYHWALVYYALYMLFKENNEAQDMEQSDFYKMLYADLVTQKIAQQKSMELIHEKGGAIQHGYFGKGAYLPGETSRSYTGQEVT